MQLHAYNYFKKIGFKAEKPQGRADQDKDAEDRNTHNDDSDKSLGLSQTKIDYLKQIPKEQLIQAGFGDLNLDDESEDCEFLSETSVNDSDY